MKPEDYERIIFDKELCDNIRYLVMHSPATMDEALAYLTISTNFERDIFIIKIFSERGYNYRRIVEILTVLNHA